MYLERKMVNLLMLSGKKRKARKILRDSFNVLKASYKVDPSSTFTKAILAVRPSFELRSIRMGGRTQQVPMPLKKGKQISLGMKKIISTVRHGNKEDISQKLAHLLSETAKLRGTCVKDQVTLHKTVESNRAFAHYRWV
jgi:small subunit ribosomal protein S7